MKKHHIPIAHLATVLLHVFKKREASWKECKEGPKAETLIPLMKEQTPVFIVDALKFGAFLRMPKKLINADDKTFKVAFPGYDVKDLPAFRKKAISDKTNKKGAYDDSPMFQKE